MIENQPSTQRKGGQPDQAEIPEMRQNDLLRRLSANIVCECDQRHRNTDDQDQIKHPIEKGSPVRDTVSPDGDTSPFLTSFRLI